jgi:hypothetical protein
MEHNIWIGADPAGPGALSIIHSPEPPWGARM